MNLLSENLPENWRSRIAGIDEHLRILNDSLALDISRQHINPSVENIFAAFQLPPEEVKVIILGQDPYPNPAHATGLAFSIPPSIAKFPPTLKNILKEYSDDLGFIPPQTGDLSPWVHQGVLLLNPILTTKSGESLAHSNLGWEAFTVAILESLSDRPIVGILWGNNARKYERFFDSHLCITSVHPSPLSAYRGFFGSKPFSRANSLLDGAGISPINWRL